MEVKNTKTQSIYEELRQSILSGELTPGERLVIRALAKKFNVSEIPVREALIELSKEGLIYNIPHSGMRVASFSFKKLVDILCIREVLEPFATGIAANNMDQEGLDKLSICLDEMNRCYQSKDTMSYAKYNREFHLTIISYSNNKELIDFLKRLFDLETQVMCGFSIYPQIVESSLREHRLILEYLASKDGYSAEKLVYIHKKRYFDFVKDYYMEQCPAHDKNCEKTLGRTNKH